MRRRVRTLLAPGTLEVAQHGDAIDIGRGQRHAVLGHQRQRRVGHPIGVLHRIDPRRRGAPHRCVVGRVGRHPHPVCLGRGDDRAKLLQRQIAPVRRVVGVDLDDLGAEGHVLPHRVGGVGGVVHDAVFLRRDIDVARLEPGGLSPHRTQARTRHDHPGPVHAAVVDRVAEGHVPEAAAVAQVPHGGDAGLQKSAGAGRPMEGPERGSLDHHGSNPLQGAAQRRVLQQEQVDVRVDQPREHGVLDQIDHPRALGCLQSLAHPLDLPVPDQDVPRRQKPAGLAVEEPAGMNQGGAGIGRRLGPRGGDREAEAEQ